MSVCAHPHCPRPTQLSNPGYATVSASADAGMQPAKYQNTDSHLAPSILQLETSFFHPHGPRNAADLMIDER